MSSQLAYLYSDNRTAVRPFSTILHTSFSPTASPRLWEKMTKWACDRWTRSHWSAESLEGFSGAFSSSKEDLGLLKTEGELPAEGAKHSNIPASEHDHPRPVLPSTLNATYSLVYLSADSPNELTTLSEDEIYIIGGIVDRNRHKVR